MRKLLLALCLAVAACGGGGHTSTTPVVANADAALTTASIGELFASRFATQVGDGRLTADFGSGVGDDVVRELAALGITTVGQLAAIIPADFDTKGFGAMANSPDANTNFAGLARDLMVIHDAKAYFAKAWNNTWSSSGPHEFPAPAAYGVDFQIFVDAGVFDSNPCGGDDGELYDGDGDGDGGDPCGE